MEELIIPLILMVLIGCLGLSVMEDMEAPTPITAENVGRYEGEKVAINLTIDEKIEEGTKLDFLMPILIPHTTKVGKSYSTYYTTIFVPIFENYRVYSTKEGILVAIDKDNEHQDMSKNTTINVVGHVRKEKDSARYAIEVK